MKKTIWSTVLLIIMFSQTTFARSESAVRKYKLIAYYSADSLSLFGHDYSRITHVIYSFGHVNSEGFFGVSHQKDIATLKGLTVLKQKYPHLRLMVALGGWGGCELCSAVFDDPVKTKRFVVSVSDFLKTYRLDGFDFDWEYPVVEGFPGHQYLPEDKDNFTNAVKLLRKSLPKGKIISFAAGGYMDYLKRAIDWKEVEPYIDFVNLMSYDLVGGNATVTGHQTPLYSPSEKEQSADRAIRYLSEINFPLHKVIIGGTFYTRSWINVADTNNGLYQTGTFYQFTDHRKNVGILTEANGYTRHWDEKAKAAHWYNRGKGIFVTGDDKQSLKAKSDYVKIKGLGGLMFWELPLDTSDNDLLNAIDINR